jgi:hypothetical protein
VGGNAGYGDEKEVESSKKKDHRVLPLLRRVRLKLSKCAILSRNTKLAFGHQACSLDRPVEVAGLFFADGTTNRSVRLELFSFVG